MDPKFTGGRSNPIINTRLKHKIPGLRRWKSQRKQLFLILLCMAISFFLMEFIFLFSDSMENTLQERRLDAYGEWQIALRGVTQQDEERVRNLPLLERAGSVWAAGSIANEGIQGASCLGGMDADAVRLARLSVLEGHLPEAPREAAVESTLLKRLGGQVGEELTLTIAPYEGENAGQAVTLQVTVCGVIKDYAFAWVIESSHDLPGVLVQPETVEAAGMALPNGDVSADQPRDHYSLLIKGQEQWDTVWEEMEEMGFKVKTGGVFLSKNTFSYPSETERQDRLQNMEKVVSVLQVFVVAVSALVLAMVIRTSVKNRRQELRDLHALGASVNTLRGLLLQEGLVLGLASMALGLGLALGLYHLLSAVLKDSVPLLLYPLVSLPHLGLAAGLGLLPVFLSYLLPWISIRRMVTEEAPAKKGKVKKRKTRKRKTPKFSTLCLREWREHPLGLAAQFLLLCGILLIPCIGIGLVWERAQGIPIFHSRHDGKYALDLPNEEEGLRQEQLERLSYIYGISEVRAWHRLSAGTMDACDGYLLSMDVRDYLDDRYVQWAVQYNMEFQQSHTEWAVNEQERIRQASDSSDEITEKWIQQSKAKERELEEGFLPVSLLSTSNDTEIQRLFENIGEGSISVSEFREGKGALLLLPAGFQREYLDGEYIEWTYQEAIQQRGLFPESMEPGMQLTLCSPNGQVQLSIGGIINNVEEDYCLGAIGLRPFTIVVSDTLFESEQLASVVPEEARERYHYVALDATSEADQVTDQQVINIFGVSDEVRFSNNRLSWEQLLDECVIRVCFCSILAGLGTLIGFLLLRSVVSYRQRERGEQLSLLSHLGMRNSWRRWMAAVEGVVPGVLAIGAVTLGMSAYRTWSYNQAHREEGGRLLALSLRIGFPVLWYLVLCIAYLLLVYLVTSGGMVKGKGKSDRR